MYRILYLGYSEKMLETLCKSNVFEVVSSIGTKGRISDRYYKLIEKYGVGYTEIQNKQELLEHIHLIEHIDLVIMYKFEFIIPKEIVDKHLIINFHGGDLHSNRGAHAVVWSILLQETKTCLSCYRLSGGVDEGYLIDAYYVAISKDDNVLTLNEKLAEGIPQMLDSIESYLLGKKEPELIRGGKYRRKIEKNDYVIDVHRDTLDSIRAKILSQQTYAGAILILDEVEYRVKNYEILVLDENRSGDRQLEVYNQYVDIYDGGKGLRLYLNSESVRK